MSALHDLVSSMTLSELARLGGRPVAEIVAYALGGGAVASSPAARPAAPRGGRSAKPRRRGAPGGGRRDPATRQAYDDQVRKLVVGARQPIAAEEVRAQVGGSQAMVRAALKRLIAQGTIRDNGATTRARRYTRA